MGYNKFISANSTINFFSAIPRKFLSYAQFPRTPFNSNLILSYPTLSKKIRTTSPPTPPLPQSKPSSYVCPIYPRKIRARSLQNHHHQPHHNYNHTHQTNPIPMSPYRRIILSPLHRPPNLVHWRNINRNMSPPI